MFSRNQKVIIDSLSASEQNTVTPQKTFHISLPPS